jgi:hypothetical protein
MQGTEIVTGAVTQANNDATKGEVGRAQIAAGGIAARRAVMLKLMF